jgi:hypothetical protein
MDHYFQIEQRARAEEPMLEAYTTLRYVARRAAPRATCQRARWLAAASSGPAVTRFDHTVFGEVVDQRGRTGGKVV